MTEREILLDNIHKLHTTELGVDRIRKNLKIDVDDVVDFCKEKISNKDCIIYGQGKNYYCEIENIKITLNANSFTIITAHIAK